jgi:cytochrome b6-f complex iron-sulfur subunit
MSAIQIITITFAAIALLAAAAVFAIAWRRGPRPDTRVALDPAASRRDRSVAGLDATSEPEAATAPDAAVVEEDLEPPPPDPLTLRPTVSEEEYGVTRRQFFNRGLLGIFGIFLAQFGIAALAFMWPRLQAGGFGSKVNAGRVEDIEGEILTPDGRVQPLFISSAQAYVMPLRADQQGTAFAGLPVVAGGLIALWQRCVHLGCRVPWCDSSLGFECPCHGSKYNAHGEYEDGPAPRNLDRFVVSVNDAGELIIDTGQVVQTARTSAKSVEYPQGPSCI